MTKDSGDEEFPVPRYVPRTLLESREWGKKQIQRQGLDYQVDRSPCLVLSCLDFAVS